MGLSETTMWMRAGILPASMASAIATKLEPLPEPRTAKRTGSILQSVIVEKAEKATEDGLKIWFSQDEVEGFVEGSGGVGRLGLPAGGDDSVGADEDSAGILESINRGEFVRGKIGWVSKDSAIREGGRLPTAAVSEEDEGLTEEVEGGGFAGWGFDGEVGCAAAWACAGDVVVEFIGDRGRFGPIGDECAVFVGEAEVETEATAGEATGGDETLGFVPAIAEDFRMDSEDFAGEVIGDAHGGRARGVTLGVVGIEEGFTCFVAEDGCEFPSEVEGRLQSVVETHGAEGR